MATPSIDWNAAFAEQRPRLVRLYMRLTGSSDVADDLAQETLMEAWRSLHKLHDDDGLPKWLNAIARNVLLRWKRQMALDARVATVALDEEIIADSTDALISPDDPTLGLEREDLARLLGRALALLPEQTRYLLIASYLWETPQAELATQIDVHESALRVRLHRSRAKLRDMLRPALAGEPDAALFTMPLGDEFPRWCPFCGKRRLVYQRIGNVISFRCSGPCIIWPPGTLGNSEKIASDDPSVALDEHLQGCHAFYRQGLHAGNVRCPTCGRVNAVTTTPPEGMKESLFSEHRRLFIRCRCGHSDTTPLWHLTIDLPEMRRFWLAHPQMQALPERALDYQGQPALLTSFVSLADAGRADIICDAATYEVLAMFTRGGIS